MSLERALEVLNAKRHRGSDHWQVVKGMRTACVRQNAEVGSPAWITEFEAVAIAEKYEREEER